MWTDFSAPSYIIKTYLFIVCVTLYSSKENIISANDLGYDSETGPYENTVKENNEHLISLLEKAGVPTIPNILSLLPPWSNVTKLYGPQPIIHGLDQCRAFRRMNKDPSNVLISPMGLHNSGTTFTRFLLESNCHIGEVSQPFWWKHAPSEWIHKDEYFILGHKRNPPETAPEMDGKNKFVKNILPVVIVKDPLHWMVSMCRSKYGQRWGSFTNEICPNLVPSENTPDLEVKGKLRYGTKLVDGTRWKRRYASLVGLWNSFNLGHYESPYPRLMIRYEDVLFHPETVVRDICECAGGVMKSDQEDGVGFRYYLQSVKPHHPSETGFLDALIRYGSDKKRLEGFTEADVDFARHKLNLFLMDKFHYTLPI